MHTDNESFIKDKLRILTAKRLHGDYTFEKNTVLGLMPLYASPENWEVAKLLMKPCLGWTVCGEPLAYTFSQIQTVPFLLLAKAIEIQQLIKYEIEENVVDVEESVTLQNYYDLLHVKNTIKERKERIAFIVRSLMDTCKAIITDTSMPKFERPFDNEIIQKYIRYKDPINRTIDVMSNNYVFLSQLMCVIEMHRMEKPSEAEYHEFFKRLVEE
jgi:hypothetical protein